MTNADEGAKKFTVTVFCGSREGNDPAFLECATGVGKVIHENGWNMVYGGGTRGLMGETARTVVKLSGHEAVHGIIPGALQKLEQEGGTSTEVFGKTTVVPDMHTRKRLMAQSSNAFLALPGGYGTAEELFEVITWNQLGIHALPIVLVNINGFYDGLVSWIDNAIEKDFISEGNRGIMLVANKAEDIPELLKNYKPAEGRVNLTWDKS